MKDVPFYANHEDNMHCQSAVYRMLFDYFLHRKYSWEEVEKLAGFKDGKAPWTVTIWERLSKLGFDIQMIEPFDYARYTQEGEPYLSTLYSPEELDWQLKHTNILDIRPMIPSFIAAVRPICKSPTLEDIDTMLADDRLVMVQLNSRVLNDEPGYVAHAVLVIDKTGDEYILHDPGLEHQQAYRRVGAAKLYAAMGGDGNSVEVTGIKLKTGKVRADIALAQRYPEFSRAALAKLFTQSKVHLDDKVLKAGDKIEPGSKLQADTSSLQKTGATLDLPVLYEDDDCVVINKPAGVLTHAQGVLSAEGTVASFLRSRSTGLEGERAGVVHRLDRATSGVIIGAKNQAALSWLQKQFAQRKTKKTYIAIVEGQLKQPEAIIDMPIERNPKAPATFRVGVNGKASVTRYKVLETGEHFSLVELKPETGRTHQLRVHLAHIGHPIVGDPLYGSGSYGDRLFLHALSLEITLPNRERKTFTAPLPPEFKEQVRA